MNKYNIKKKLVSVIMSVYSEENEILRSSIESILNQTFAHFEFIIVNDNPQNEDVKSILSYYASLDNRIKVIHNSENLGLAKSLNKAVEVSTTDYLARMDGDDISLPHRLSTQYKCIVQSKSDIVFSNRVDIDESGNFIYLSKHDYTSDEISKLLPRGNIIVHPSVMMRKETFQTVKGYREFPSAQDYDLWLRCLNRNYKFSLIKDALILYRVSKKSNSRKKQIQHVYTISYVKKLYRERKLKGNDSFSLTGYYSYLKYKKTDQTSLKNKIERNNKKMQTYKSNDRKLCKLLLYILNFITLDFFKHDYINKLQFLFWRNIIIKKRIISKGVVSTE